MEQSETYDAKIAFMCLLFLDSLVEDQIDLAACNQFEINWLKAALPQIKQTLHDSFDLEVEQQDTKIKVRGDVQKAETELATFFSTPGHIDFAAIVKGVGSSICQIVCQKFSQISPEKKQALVNFTVAPVVPFGIPEYETSFMAQCQHGNEFTLVYPNLNELTQEHFDLTEKFAAKKGRPFMHHLVKCLIVPCHEVLHFVQDAIGIRDKSNMSWSAEHDASWPSLSLLTACERQGLAQEVFLPGVVDACLVYFHRSYLAQSEQLPEQIVELYTQWQLNFGLIGDGVARMKTYYPEGFDDAEFNTIFATWKGRVAFEGLVMTDEELSIQLDMIFANGRENGTPNINDFPDPIEAAQSLNYEIPEQLLPQNQIGKIQKLAEPIGEEEAVHLSLI